MVCFLKGGLALLVLYMCVRNTCAGSRVVVPVSYSYSFGTSGSDLQFAAAEPRVVTTTGIGNLQSLPLVYEAGSPQASEKIEKSVQKPQKPKAQKPRGFSANPASAASTRKEKKVAPKEDAIDRLHKEYDLANFESTKKRQRQKPEKQQQTLQSAPIVVVAEDESPKSYAQRVHNIEPVTNPQAESSNGQAPVVLKLVQVPERVPEQVAADSHHHHHHDKEENKHHEKGGGKKHHSDHHGIHGKKQQKAYKGHHDYDKIEQGHHDKEGHKGHYTDEGGHKKKHHEEHDHYGEHHEGEEGDKGAKVKPL